MKNADEIGKLIVESFKKRFPNSDIHVGFSSRLTPTLCVSFMLAGSSHECRHNIIQNDPMLNRILVYGFSKDGEMVGKVSVENGSGLSIKSTDPLFYSQTVKIFRKFSTDSDEKLIKKFGDLFDKYLDAVKGNVDAVQQLVDFDVKTKILE